MRDLLFQIRFYFYKLDAIKKKKGIDLRHDNVTVKACRNIEISLEFYEVFFNGRF